MAKSKSLHSDIASDMIKSFVQQPDTTPQQKVILQDTSTAKAVKGETTKFTVEIQSELMDNVKLYAVKNRMKLRALFEEALAQYLQNRGVSNI